LVLLLCRRSHFYFFNLFSKQVKTNLLPMDNDYDNDYGFFIDMEDMKDMKDLKDLKDSQAPTDKEKKGVMVSRNSLWRGMFSIAFVYFFGPWLQRFLTPPWIQPPPHFKN